MNDENFLCAAVGTVHLAFMWPSDLNYNSKITFTTSKRLNVPMNLICCSILSPCSPNVFGKIVNIHWQEMANLFTLLSYEILRLSIWKMLKAPDTCMSYLVSFLSI